MQSFDVNAHSTTHSIGKMTRLALAISVMTFSLVGCGNSGDKVANKDKTSNTPEKSEKLDCSSANVASVIQQTIINQISKQATTNVQQLAQQAGIANTNIDMTSLVSQMNVAVTNSSAIAGQADQCQANIAVTLPQSVLTKADQIATSLNQPAIAQNLASKGLNLDNNTITAINAVFKMSPSEGSYNATSPNGTSTSSVLVAEVGNLVGNAHLAQVIGTAGNVPTVSSASGVDGGISNEPTNASSNANSAISNEPTNNQTIASNPPVSTNRSQTSNQTVNQGNTPIVVKKTTTTTTLTEKPKPPTPKKVEKSTTTLTEKQHDENDGSEKTVVKTTTTSSKTIKDAASEKSTVKKDTTNVKPKTEMGPAAKSKTELGPAAKPTPKSVGDDDIKLIIEEKNEKY